MSSKEQDRLFGLPENSEINVTTAGTDITYYFKDSGIDTATSIYYNLEKPANLVMIRPSGVVSIISINGKTLKDPITVQTTGLTFKHIQAIKMVIRTGAASINLKVIAQ